MIRAVSRSADRVLNTAAALLGAALGAALCLAVVLWIGALMLYVSLTLAGGPGAVDAFTPWLQTAVRAPRLLVDLLEYHPDQLVRPAVTAAVIACIIAIALEVLRLAVILTVRVVMAVRGPDGNPDEETAIHRARTILEERR